MKAPTFARCSGLAGLAALLLLTLWAYSLIAQSQEWVLVGRIGDALIVVQCVALLPVVVALHRRLQPRLTLGHGILLVIGTLGAVLLPLVQILHLLRVIGLAREAPVAIGAIFLIGVWVALITLAQQPAPRALLWPGIGSGLSAVLLLGGLVILVVTVPGVQSLSGQSLHSVSIPLLLAALGFLGWGVGVPTWSLMVSRSGAA